MKGEEKLCPDPEILPAPLAFKFHHSFSSPVDWAQAASNRIYHKLNNVYEHTSTQPGHRKLCVLSPYFPAPDQRSDCSGKYSKKPRLDPSHASAEE